jgi:hypothetical protein
VKIVAHQPEYLPWLGYFAKLSVADVFFFSDHLQYAIKDFQNRNNILQSGARCMLSVPVRTKGRVDQAIRDVEIELGAPWARKHMRTLRQAYHGHPYFALYAPRLEEIYASPWEKLCDLDITLIKQIAQWLDIAVPMRLSSELDLREHKTRLLIEMCEKTGADTFVSGRGAAAYVEPALFAEKQLHHLFFRFTHPTYPQKGAVGSTFVSHLSTLDLLFNCGPRSGEVLRQAVAVSRLASEAL